MKVYNSVFAEQTDDNISSVYKAQVVAYTLVAVKSVTIRTTSVSFNYHKRWHKAVSSQDLGCLQNAGAVEHLLLF